MSDPRIMRITALVATASFVVLVPTSASADGEDERAASRLFRAGSAAYERGDYTAAAHAFEEAHRRVPRGATAYNAALAWEAAGERPRAADAFESALADPALAAAAEGDARGRLATLERDLGVVEVAAGAGCSLSVAHVVDATPPKRIHLVAGEHTVTIRCKNGHEARRSVAVEPRRMLAVEFPDEAPAPVAQRHEAKQGDAHETSSGAALRTASWIGIGAGALSAAAGAILGASALRARDTFDRSGRTDDDARSDAVALRTWANVGFAGAIAFGGAGLALLLASPRTKTSARLQMSPTSLTWSGTF